MGSVARFLETRGKLDEALEIATDSDYKFDLAVQLGKLEIAKVNYFIRFLLDKVLRKEFLSSSIWCAQFMWMIFSTNFFLTLECGKCRQLLKRPRVNPNGNNLGS